MTVSAPDGQTNEGGSMSTIVPRRKLDHPGGVPWDMFGEDRYLAGENKWALSRQDLDWKGPGTKYQTILLANHYGWSVSGMHTQGDIGAKMVLDVFEEANRERSIAGRHFGTDHGMIRDEEDLRRAVNLGANNSFNSNYVMGPGNRSQVYMFGEYIHGFSPVKSAVDAGMKPGLEMGRAVAVRHPGGAGGHTALRHPDRRTGSGVGIARGDHPGGWPAHGDDLECALYG